jgi:hypothetical protein
VQVLTQVLSFQVQFSKSQAAVEVDKPQAAQVAAA